MHFMTLRIFCNFVKISIVFILIHFYSNALGDDEKKDKHDKVDKAIIKQYEKEKALIFQIQNIQTRRRKKNPFKKAISFSHAEHNAKAIYHAKHAEFLMLNEFKNPQRLNQRYTMFENPAQLALEKYREVLLEYKNVMFPDSIFISNIINNMGCAFLYNSGTNQLKTDSAFFLIDKEKVINSIWYFDQSIKYNKSNIVSKNNLNYLKSVLNDSLLIYPPSNDKNLFTFTNDTIVIDSVPELQYDFALRINKKFLLDNADEMVEKLSNYDEILLVVDHSYSMSDSIGIKNKEGSRFNYLKNTMLYVFSKLSPVPQYGIISIGGRFCDFNKLLYRVGEHTPKDIIELFVSLYPEGGTPLNRSLLESRNLFTLLHNKKAILMLSDGLNTSGCPPANLNLCEYKDILKEAGIDIYVFSALLQNVRRYADANAIYNCFADMVFGFNEKGTVKPISVLNLKISPFFIPNNINFYHRDKYYIPFNKRPYIKQNVN